MPISSEQTDVDIEDIILEGQLCVTDGTEAGKPHQAVKKRATTWKLFLSGR